MQTNTSLPLIPHLLPTKNTYPFYRQCTPGSLDPNKVKGKIVLCLGGNAPTVGTGMEVKRAGGAAVILGNFPAEGAEISVDAHVLPGTAVLSDDVIAIRNYINSTRTPTAKIIPAKTVLNVKEAPFMAAFSSQGPNALDPNILKVGLYFNSHLIMAYL